MIFYLLFGFVNVTIIFIFIDLSKENYTQTDFVVNFVISPSVFKIDKFNSCILGQLNLFPEV